jgi:N-acetylmuramoyl-L-alanine amidase
VHGTDRDRGHPPPRTVRSLLLAPAAVALAALAACSATPVGPSRTAPKVAAAAATFPNASSSAQAAQGRPASTMGALHGLVVALDPGHNGGNALHGAQIARLVNIGNGRTACDTTGTETNGGYPEYAFTLDVATRLATLLRAAGATVVLTRTDSRGVGPCIDERAAIGDRAHAAAAISIHGDGAPSSDYGFHVIVPRGIGRNNAIVAPSRLLGTDLRDAFRAGTGEPLSTYIGTTTGALVARDDLGGLNLSDVPKVFIECGNMRNAADAGRMTNAAWRQRAAVALATGLTRYLGRG